MHLVFLRGTIFNYTFELLMREHALLTHLLSQNIKNIRPISPASIQSSTNFVAYKIKPI